jgi:hypothetical protein
VRPAGSHILYSTIVRAAGSYKLWPSLLSNYESCRLLLEVICIHKTRRILIDIGREPSLNFSDSLSRVTCPFLWTIAENVIKIDQFLAPQVNTKSRVNKKKWNNNGEEKKWNNSLQELDVTMVSKNCNLHVFVSCWVFENNSRPLHYFCLRNRPS